MYGVGYCRTPRTPLHCCCFARLCTVVLVRPYATLVRDRFAPVQLHNGAALPAGWIAQTELATGRPFFVDIVTGISHWSLPPAFPMTAPAGAPELLATGWGTVASQTFSYFESPNAR
jgi:hypothetical protein